MRRFAIALTTLCFAAVAAAQQAAAPSYDPRAAFAATDKNKDGYIDHAEFHNRIVEIFYFSDKDKDGLCRPGELEVFDAATLFQRADTDGDGSLSLHEFLEARFEDFARADTNGDELLDVDEVIVEFERH